MERQAGRIERSPVACLFTVFLGELPGWMRLWEQTAANNTSVDFYLFTDQDFLPKYTNIKSVKVDLIQLESRFRTLIDGISIPSPYKLCDFKPLFGEAFEEISAPYTFWGFGDVDVIYGDLDRLISERGDAYDYISTGWNGESGPLAFFRNSGETRSLWRRSENVKEQLEAPEITVFDERDFLELLKQNVRCDIVFRECLHDVPALLQGGRITSLATGQEYYLHHFGGRLSHTRTQISRDAAGLARHLANDGAVYISRKHRLVAEPEFRSPLAGRVWRKTMKAFG